MYVVKVGDFYIVDAIIFEGWVAEIQLSREIKRAFQTRTAEKLAKMTNGEVIKYSVEVGNE